MKYFYSIALTLIISCSLSGQNSSNYTDVINNEINGQSTNNRFDHFVTNQGQWDEKIQYKSSIGGASVSFLQSGISFANMRENEDLLIPLALIGDEMVKSVVSGLAIDFVVYYIGVIA